MKMRSYTIVANWKMYLLPKQAVEFVEHAYKELVTLCDKKNIQLVLCPSIEALSMVKEVLKDMPVFLGAQDCSAFKNGPYTGNVAAAALHQIGCTYCIIGHSETKKYHKQTDQDCAQKALRLLEIGITPIICCGETEAEHKNNKIEGVIASQLMPILQALNTRESLAEILIAYEPLWAIGTGITPDPKEIETTFEFIRTVAKDSGLKNQLKLLYGGSVNSETVKKLKTVQNCDGFLIGSASTDFQELKKIVDLL